METINYVDEMSKKLENIKHELFSGGGIHQALFLLETLLCCDDNTFNMEDVLRRIGREYDNLNEKLKIRFIIPIVNFDYLAENGKEYVCLDTDLRLCVKKKGDADWHDVAFVMPYADVSSIRRMIYDYDNKLEEENLDNE